MTDTIEQYKPKRLLNSLVACLLDNEEVYLNELIESFPKGLFKKVISTTNSEEAINLASSRAIDVLICDFRMPKRNGITILELCRKENPELIPILSTGYVLSQKELMRCKELGIEKVSKIEPLDSLLASISIRANELIDFDEDSFVSSPIERESLLTKKIHNLISKSSHTPVEAVQEIDQVINNELISLFKDLSQILIDRYRRIPNMEEVIIISSPDESTSLGDLINDLNNMTPKGLHHLELWLKVNTLEYNDTITSTSKKNN